MIFDKEYDESLWLIMNKDKKVAKELVYLFRTFPQEVLKSVRDLIKKYKEKIHEGLLLEELDELERQLFGSYMGDNGLLYYYKVDLLGSIEISEVFSDEDGEVPIRCMILYPFDREEFKDMKLCRDMSLATIAVGFEYINNKIYVVNRLATDVQVKKTILGNIIDSYGYYTDFKHSRHHINVNNIPEDYSVEEILESDVAKKLVRKKKSN